MSSTLHGSSISVGCLFEHHDSTKIRSLCGSQLHFVHRKEIYGSSSVKELPVRQKCMSYVISWVILNYPFLSVCIVKNIEGSHGSPNDSMYLRPPPLCSRRYWDRSGLQMPWSNAQSESLNSNLTVTALYCAVCYDLIVWHVASSC